MTEHSPVDGVIAAAIDIGSNSLKMTVGRLDAQGGIEQLGWDSEVVRLGHGLDETGRLEEARMDLAVATLQRFREKAESLGATRIAAVATEATRSAENGEEFLARVREQADVTVQVVQGLEEALLTFRGLEATTDIRGHVVIADIGGGSTELIVANEGVVLGARSIPLGSGRLTDRLAFNDPPSPGELSAGEREADVALEAAARSLKLPKGEDARLIVVGGTGEFMTRLVSDESAIDLAAIKAVLGKLAVLNAEEVADEIEIPRERARVLPAGVAIISAIAGRVQPTRVEIARAGVRTGLLFDLLNESQGQARAAGASQKTANNRPRTRGQSRNAKASAIWNSPNEASFRAAMAALIAERWTAVHKTIPAAIEGTDIEGVHDVRVASRRLRAAMDIAAPAFPRRWYKPLHRSAKEITRALGEVRDRDVLLESLNADRAAAAAAETPGIDRLIARVDRERVVARAAMESYLGDLLESDIWREVDRRFGDAHSGGHGSPARERG